MEPEKTTYSRREFNTLMLMLVSMFTATTTTTGKKRKGKMIKSKAYVPPADGEMLVIDFLPDSGGWSLTYPVYGDDWRMIEIDPDDISPRVARQLAAAKAAPYGTPVACRVMGDKVAILTKCRYFEPGEEDDRGCGDFDPAVFNSWRLEYFGEDIERLPTDNTSWWQHRLTFDRNDRENAFAAEWLKENGPNYHGGSGIAQMLMLSTYELEKPKDFEPWLSNRERKILATFVQWLGTNCGQAFLSEVQRRGGIPKGLI